ncbi:MAG: hypothetical protein JXA33_24995 [Anaerolineae bacterium]|nr:hypothetical protein [Anaerolineae bacterium]
METVADMLVLGMGLPALKSPPVVCPSGARCAMYGRSRFLIPVGNGGRRTTWWWWSYD